MLFTNNTISYYILCEEITYKYPWNFQEVDDNSFGLNMSRKYKQNICPLIYFRINFHNNLMMIKNTF